MNFTVVLVTYNRIVDLKKSLACYDYQVLLPKIIIVVNNASSDGTEEFLNEWQSKPCSYSKIVINNPENTGGAGGFNAGMNAALKTDCDFIFLADDDAFAKPNTLKLLDDFYASYSDRASVSALCTSVVGFGEYDTLHRRRIVKNILSLKDTPIAIEDYSNQFFCVDKLSFVGAAIKKEIAEEIGLPLKEYFIYNDDSEYSLRLKEKGEILCIPASIMEHNVRLGVVARYWAEYYSWRNYLDMIRRHFPKRYWYFAIAKLYLKRCTILAKIFRKRSNAYIKMSKTMISDSIQGRLGKSEKYPPGCKID